MDRQIESEYYKVIYFDIHADKKKEMLVGNSSDSTYTIVDILKQVEEWFKEQTLNIIVIGIEELDQVGFNIFYIRE